MEASMQITRRPSVSGSDDEAAVGPLTEPLERFRSKDLRREVYRLKLRVIRKGPDANDHKSGYMELLRAYWAGNPAETLTIGSVETEQGTTLTDERGFASHEKETFGICDLGFSPPNRSEIREETEDSTRLRAEDNIDKGPLFNATSCHEESCTVTQSSGALQMESEIGTTQEEDGNSCSTDVEFGHYGGGQCITLEDPFNYSAAHWDAKRVSSDQGPSRPPGWDQQKSTRGCRGEVLGKTQVCLNCVESSEGFDKMRKRKAYWEDRLSISKRKMRDLREELQRMDEVYDYDLLKHELAYYRRERKKALQHLLNVSEADHQIIH